MFRNQTIYYPPELQMRGFRSTPKRAKAAIPIVNPKVKNSILCNCILEAQDLHVHCICDRIICYNFNQNRLYLLTNPN